MKTFFVCGLVLLLLSGCDVKKLRPEAEPAAAVDWLEVTRNAGAVVPVLVLFWYMWKWNQRHEEREHEARRAFEALKEEQSKMWEREKAAYCKKHTDDVFIIRGEGPCGPMAFEIPTTPEIWKCEHCGRTWPADRVQCETCGAPKV